MQETKPVAVLLTRLLQLTDDSLFREECAVAYACVLDKLPLESFYEDGDCSGLEVTVHPNLLARQSCRASCGCMSSHSSVIYQAV